MASGRLLIPSWMPALDGNGDPIPGVNAFFYVNMTTTLAAVYADKDLTTPLSNPVEANANGRFPAIWADADALYSVAIEAPYGPAGVPFSYDNLSVSLGAEIATAEATESAADDAATSLAAIQAALDAAMANDGSAAAAGAAAGTVSGEAAGTAAATAVVATKLDKLSSLTALSAATTGVPYRVGYRTAPGDGYAGDFEWIAGDQSANVTADPLQGIWVAPSSAPTGASGAWKRVFDGAALAEWFGASAADDSAAILNAMAATVGYIRIGGAVRIGSSVTLDAPIFVGDRAYFTVDAGVTLSLTNTLNAPDQWIFRGDGDVLIPLPDTDSGEDIRELRAIWFGAFTQVESDQAPALQKAINALGNSREGVVWLDCGSYNIGSGMTLGRGVKIASTAGTRRTVFQITADGFPVFRTLNTACMFYDIQFENHPTSLTRVSPFIQVDHDFCEIEHIFHQSSKYAIVVNGVQCKIRDIEGVYGGSTAGADSAQILVQAEGCEIDGVRARFSSGGGPTAVVEIGTGASASVTGFYVNNVETRYGSISVLINANNVSVARGQINNIRYRGSSAAEATVKIKTSGTGSVFGITFSGINGSNLGTGLVKIEQGSSASVSDLSFDDIYDAGTSGVAFDISATAGSVSDIKIGHNVTSLRPNLVTATGAVTGIKSAVKRRLAKTANFTVPSSGAEDGILYNVVSGSAVAATLPAEALEPLGFEIASTGTGVTTLTAASGATINGGATLALTAGRLYRVAVVRNVGGTAAQWSASG